MEIPDGNSSDSKSKGRFCGYPTPKDIRSSERYEWLRFRADQNRHLSYAGFKATFAAGDKPSTVQPTPTDNDPSGKRTSLVS